MKKLLLASAVAMALLPMTAAARGRIGVFAGPRFAPYSWYGSYGWYGPFYGPYSWGPYFGTPNAGEVKVDTKVKDAEVFIDGSFAGTVGKLKTMRLRPGRYNIEIRAPGRTPFAENIYVVAGKTIHLNPDLRVDARP
jgi:hypothetical protein